MKGALFVGILVIAGIIFLTLAIIAAAPYLAVLIMLGGLFWWSVRDAIPKVKPPE